MGGVFFVRLLRFGYLFCILRHKESAATQRVGAGIETAHVRGTLTYLVGAMRAPARFMRRTLRKRQKYERMLDQRGDANR